MTTKTNRLFIVSVCVFLFSTAANASYSTLCSTSSGSLPYGFTDTGTTLKTKVSSKFLMYNCQTKRTIWLLNGNLAAQVEVCDKCYPSATLVPSIDYDEQIPEMQQILGCTGFGDGYGCRYCGDACSSGTWADVSGHPGYQSRTAGDHPINECTCGNEYRCAANYYGTPTVSGSTYSGCTKCNTIFGVQSTSAAGSTSCTSCCIPQITSGSDTAGQFSTSGECCNTSC